MKRLQFRLESVLTLKEQRERMADLQVKQARAALEMARAVVHALHEQLARSAAALVGRVGQVVTPGAWGAYYEHSFQVGRALEAAEANVAKAQANLEQAMDQRTQVRKEVEALLHLRKEQWRDHWAEHMRREQVRLDELGLQRWRQAQQAEAESARTEGEGL